MAIAIDVQSRDVAMLSDEGAEVHPWYARWSYQVFDSQVYHRSKQAVRNTFVVTKEALYFTGVAAWQAGSSIVGAGQSTRGAGKQDADVDGLESTV